MPNGGIRTAKESVNGFGFAIRLKDFTSNEWTRLNRSDMVMLDCLDKMAMSARIEAEACKTSTRKSAGHGS